MEIQESTREGCTVLALRGRLDRRAAPRLQQVLRKRLTQQPVAVVCDLSGLQSLDPDCAGLFTVAAHHPSSSWPDTPLLLCCAAPTVAEALDRLGVPRFVPVHASLEDAVVLWERGDELYRYLRQGHTQRHGIAGGPMAEVVRELAQVPDADVRAMATYLASFNPEPVAQPQAAAQRVVDTAARAQGQLLGPAQRMFDSACASCHQQALGWNNRTPRWAAPSPWSSSCRS